MPDNQALFKAWEVAARELVQAGYERREARNPNVPTTFHQNGTVIILVLDDQNEWQPKPLDLKEPTMY